MPSRFATWVPNELVTVLDQGPEVGEHLQPVGRRQDLTEYHLRKVFRKLDVKSRIQLARRIS